VHPELAEESLDLRRDESALREALAYLVVDEGFYSGKYGRLTITDQRLLWAPFRLPLLRTRVLEIEIGDILQCELQVRNLGPSALVVAAYEHSFAFQIGGSFWNPLAYFRRDNPEEWLALLQEQGAK